MRVLPGADGAPELVDVALWGPAADGIGRAPLLGQGVMLPPAAWRAVLRDIAEACDAEEVPTVEWYATNTGNLVAEVVRGGGVRLTFGKHEGDTLQQVPRSYLKWMLSKAGSDFLPEPLRQLVRRELARREAPPTLDAVEWPDVRDGPATVAWAADAPGGDVQDLRDHLLDVVAHIDRVLWRRADELCDRLIRPEPD